MEKWFPIETQRLLLREFTAADEANVHEYGSDPVVSRYDSWGPNTPDDTHQVLSKWIEQQQTWPRDEINVAVELRATGKQIGGLRLHILNGEHGIAEFGYALNREFWGQGFATEAARVLIDKAFSVHKLHRLIATCDTRNVASARVMKKLGMRREAHFRQDVFQKGEWRDSYLYSILEQDRTTDGVDIRPFRPGDETDLLRVFRRAVSETAISKYPQTQVTAWLSSGPTEESLRTSMRDRDVFVAVRDGTALRWIDLLPDGHIDMFYCSPEASGSGVADRLYATVLERAKSLGVSRLYSEASRFAESFFKRHDWKVDERETIQCDGVDIVQAKMSVLI
ncbi:MAG TPA: GNAT family N-acetyltransferase [Candidatus Tumulicola sp.]|nr:GNAT family N-acetyltransferase [Candidatus Tumulicola sp.]